MADSLDRVAGSLGVARAGALSGLFGDWERLVGTEVAAHARPLSLRRQTLVVGVDHPGWATQLRYLETDLLRALEQTMGPGGITRIEVRVRP